MAMKKREPGFLGLAKQNAKKQGMLTIPKRWTPQGGGAEEYPAFVNQQEMALLKQQGGKGFMTPYGIPSFEEESQLYGGTDDMTGDMGNTSGIDSSAVDSTQNFNDGGGGSGSNSGQTPTAAPAAPKKTYSFSYDSTKTLGQNIDSIDIAGWWDSLGTNKPKGVTKENAKDYLNDNPDAAQQAITQQGGPDAAAAATEGAKKEEKKKLSGKRAGHIEGVMRDAEGRTEDDKGVMTDASGKVEGDEGYDPDTAELQGGYDKSTAEMDTTDSYEGYKQEAKGLGAEAKDITGQFGEDATKLGAYKDKFDTMAGTAKDRGDAGEGFLQGQGIKYAAEAGTGQTAATDAAAGIKSATAQGQTAAGEGAAGFKQGAQDVAGVQGRFGEEGFEKDVSGYESQIQKMGEKAMSGDVGQSQAAMLKGQMEEGRMASQKGSEEKLRRSMAQSGASPAEIATKVAQFQKQSAGQQAQAGRSEALSSQLQGQQMGQSQLGQAAGLMGQGAGMAGQRAGMAGQQASLGAQQAAIKGQAAGMQMQGAQMGMSGAQMGMQGAQQAGQMGMAGAQMGMSGAQSAGQMGMQGAQNAGQMGMQGAQMGMSGAQMGMQGVQGAGQMYGQGQASALAGIQGQGQMMGQGIGALQAQQGGQQAQLGGIKTQGGLVGEQAGMTQAELNDTMAQQAQAYSAEQTEATRTANASANSGGGGSGGGGGFLGKLFSDIRLKDNIELLKEGKDGDPNIYSFNYKWDSDTTWSGVMAQELLNTRHADAVETHSNGYYMVDYSKLGIPMTQLST